MLLRVSFKGGDGFSEMAFSRRGYVWKHGKLNGLVELGWVKFGFIELWVRFPGFGVIDKIDG